MQRNSKGQFISGGRPEMKKGKNLSCKLCGKMVYIPKHRLKTFGYCSRKCSAKEAYKSRIYTSVSKEIREKISKTLVGKYRGYKSPHWKGGRYSHADGYIYLYAPNHPYKNKDGYVFEHRLVIENYLQRFLSKDEHIHHKNGIKNDNRLENLKIFSNSQHLKYEWNKGNMKNASKTWFKKGQIPWNKQAMEILK